MAHTIDLQYGYEEVNGPGFGSAIVSILDSIGNKIYTRKVDGSLLDIPQISADGKYLSLMYQITPYWFDSLRCNFQLIRLRDNKVVYEMNFNQVYQNKIGNWLNLKNNFTLVFLME